MCVYACCEKEIIDDTYFANQSDVRGSEKEYEGKIVDKPNKQESSSTPFIDCCRTQGLALLMVSFSSQRPNTILQLSDTVKHPSLYVTHI